MKLYTKKETIISTKLVTSLNRNLSSSPQTTALLSRLANHILTKLFDTNALALLLESSGVGETVDDAVCMVSVRLDEVLRDIP